MANTRDRAHLGIKIIRDILSPLLKQKNDILTQLLDTHFERTGSRIAIYKGEIIAHNTQSKDPPKLLHKSLAGYVDSLHETEDRYNSYLRQMSRYITQQTHTHPNETVFHFFPVEVFQEYIGRPPDVKRTDEHIPEFLKEIIAEMKLLRSLYA